MKIRLFLVMSLFLIHTIYACSGRNRDLFFEAGWGSTFSVQNLLENGADVNATDKFGNTPLMKAAENDRIDIVKFLIDNGADVDAMDTLGNTPLIEAISGGHIDIVKLLIDNSADVNIQEEESDTALMRAAREGYIDIVKLLIDHSADVNAMDKWGSSPLSKALYGGHIDIVTLLKEKGAYGRINESYRNIYLQAVNMPGMDIQRRLQYQEVMQNLLHMIGFKVIRDDTPYIGNSNKPPMKGRSMLGSVKEGSKWIYQLPENQPNSDILMLYEILPHSYTKHRVTTETRRTNILQPSAGYGILESPVSYDIHTLIIVTCLIDLRTEKVIKRYSKMYDNEPSVSEKYGPGFPNSKSGLVKITIEQKTPLTLNTEISPFIKDICVLLGSIYKQFMAD
jgi:hypothetical protein